MGKTSNVLNHYFRNKECFSDFVNGIFFRGAHVIQPEQLTDASEVYVEAEAENADTGATGKYLERIRDIKMRLDTGELLAILAVENQSAVDYAMPFRCLQYDTMEYGRQLEDLRHKNDAEDTYSNWAEKACKIKKTDRLIPVYTLCVYYGEDIWDGPRSLKDMMDFGNNEGNISSHFADYPLSLYCLNEEHDFSVFQTEIRQLFELLKYRKNKKGLKKLLEQTEEYRHIDAATLEVIAVMLNAPRLWENRTMYVNNNSDREEYDMCQALREWVEEERSIGTLLTLFSLVNQGLLQLKDAAKQVNMTEMEFREKMAESIELI